MRTLRSIALVIACFIAIIGYGFLLGWLSDQVGWPERYGFACHGKECMFLFPWHSFALLRHGGLIEFLLFIVIWGIFPWVAAIVIWIRPLAIQSFSKPSSVPE